MKRLMLATLAAVIMAWLAFPSAGISAPKDRDVSGDAPRITMEKLKSMLGNPNLVIIDSLVGDQWETVAEKLPGAVHEDPDDVDSWADKYPKDKIIVTYQGRKARPRLVSDEGDADRALAAHGPGGRDESLMYSSSKHGVRFLLKQQGLLPENAAAPTCLTCHMQDRNNEVRTAWGFMALRLPTPDDKVWAEARKLIFQAYGLLKPDGNPGTRLDLVKAMDVMRLTQEDWGKERDKMVKTCRQCHSGKFASGELKKGDKMIRETDILLAEAILLHLGTGQMGVSVH